jgi:hypothetical protein
LKGLRGFFQRSQARVKLFFKIWKKPGASGYSGGRDQEDHGSEPAWANSLREVILKIPSIKKG